MYKISIDLLTSKAELERKTLEARIQLLQLEIEALEGEIQKLLEKIQN